jgi:hypothetical protein
MPEEPTDEAGEKFMIFGAYGEIMFQFQLCLR